ncbi:MAG: hypothetical protein ACOYKE_15550, partial [Ferruginibacter sp.]
MSTLSQLLGNLYTPTVYPSSGIANSTGSAWGTSYSTSGSGTALALTTSPTFITPVLGTPSSGTLTNCTGLPVGGISATGTPSITTYLRGDGAWSTVSGGGGSSTITIDNKTAAYTIVTGDLGKVINCTSGTFTISLTAAATLGSGFNVTIWNTSATSTDVITIDPNGAETIDGSTTITLRLGEGTEIVSNGTNWITGDKKSMRYYAENATTLLRPVASGTASIAMGNGGYASGSGAIAIGNGRVDGYSGATDANAIAIGGGARGTGFYCVSVGADSNALGNSSVGLGTSATATTNYATAVGGISNASGSE